MKSATTETERQLAELSLAMQRAERYKIGRNVAEKLLEEKSSELYVTNEALRQSQENLQQEVAQATYELQTSNIRLKKALEEKSTFIGSLSHELRTPMNAVIGLSELLLDMPMEELQKDYVNTIFESARGLAKLINSVLDISKIEAGKVILNPSPTDCRKAGNTVTKMFALEAKQQQTELILTVADEVPSYLLIDEGRYTQILTNLISNAIKNTNGGKVSISIGVSEGENGKQLTTQVSDNGVGISGEHTEKIFNAYEQFGNLSLGVGLGLAICRFLTELMNGELSCESEVGVGSKFVFSVPLLSCPEQNLENGSEVDDAKIKLLRVLVAEDNAINQKVLVAQLAQFGIRPTVVENGQLAVEALSKNSFDVVFLDIQMPVLDGEKTLQFIREQIEGGKEQYVIALTATSYYSKKAQMLEIGFNDFLSKPLALNELKNALAQVPNSGGEAVASEDCQVNSDVNMLDMSFFEGQFGDAAPEILRQLTPVFLEHSYIELEQLQNAITAKEFSRIRKLSHSLKGAVATMGQLDLASRFEKLEKEAEETNVNEQIENINVHMKNFKTSLTLFLSNQ